MLGKLRVIGNWFLGHLHESLSLVIAILLLPATLAVRSCVSPPAKAGPKHPASFLKSSDREAVRVDTVRHTITIAMPTGTKTEYVRDPVIHIAPDGRVTVDRRLWGFENNPFFGVGYGEGSRAYLGVSWLYFWRLDLNTQIGFSGESAYRTVVLVPTVSYNFWRSTSAFIGLDVFKTALQQTPAYHAGMLVHF